MISDEPSACPAPSPSRGSTLLSDPEADGPAADLVDCLDRLRQVVVAACGSQGQWEKRIAVGIRAALEFVARDPFASGALCNRTREAGRQRDEEIAWFSRMLDAVAPASRTPGDRARGSVVESIACIIGGYTVAGRAGELPGLAPELTTLALLPYADLSSARRWGDRAAASPL